MWWVDVLGRQVPVAFDVSEAPAGHPWLKSENVEGVLGGFPASDYKALARSLTRLGESIDAYLEGPVLLP